MYRDTTCPDAIFQGALATSALLVIVCAYVTIAALAWETERAVTVPLVQRQADNVAIRDSKLIQDARAIARELHAATGSTVSIEVE